MADAKPVTMTAAQAHDRLPDDLRNDIYSALLSGTGIHNIEATLDHEMRATGFRSNLKAYIVHLLRSGECTNIDDIMSRVKTKIEHDTQLARSTTNGATNGNGVNGHTKDGDEYDLALPNSVVTAGARTVGVELDKICDITPVDDEK